MNLRVDPGDGLTDVLRRLCRRVVTASRPRWQGIVVIPLTWFLRKIQPTSFERALRIEYSFRRALGQPLSERSWPRMTFNDKITYRRLRLHDPLLHNFSDKLSMRDYVTGNLGVDCLPTLIEVSQSVSVFAQLEGPFVLKANHGSGMVELVGAQRMLSQEQQRNAESWLARDYCWDGLEWGYFGARRLLLVEEFLSVQGGEHSPPDYKFFVFDGRVEMIQIDTARFEHHQRMLRRPDWSPINGSLGRFEIPDANDAARPANLGVMLEWAAQLGNGVDFVRVDLYDTGERVLVGELTPYPGGGDERFIPRSLDAWLGKKWTQGPSIR